MTTRAIWWCPECGDRSTNRFIAHEANAWMVFNGPLTEREKEHRCPGEPIDLVEVYTTGLNLAAYELGNTHRAPTNPDTMGFAPYRLWEPFFTALGAGFGE